MIFTIGDKKSYIEAAKNGKLFKIGKSGNYEGGYAFETIEEAQWYIEYLGEQDNYAVFGLDCDMSNTVSNRGYSNLIQDALIIILSD